MIKSRSLALLAVSAALAALAACNDKSPTSTDAGQAPSAVAPTPSSSAALAPKERAKPPVREGGALVRAAGEEALWLADEDHRAVRKIPLPVPADASAL